MKVFLDTCALAALSSTEDDLHLAAKTVYASLHRNSYQLYTSDYILDETYTLLAARRGHHKAVAFMDGFEGSGVELLRVDARIESAAKTLFRKLDFESLSFTDCTSFALINAHRIDHVFTFDKHFSFFRFNHPVVILGE